jgi:hypothetical protein
MPQFTIGTLLEKLERGAKKNADLLGMNVCHVEFGSITPSRSILLDGKYCVIDRCGERQLTVSDIILALRQFINEDESARDFAICHVEFGGLEKTQTASVEKMQSDDDDDQYILCLSR